MTRTSAAATLVVVGVTALGCGDDSSGTGAQGGGGGGPASSTAMAVGSTGDATSSVSTSATTATSVTSGSGDGGSGGGGSSGDGGAGGGAGGGADTLDWQPCELVSGAAAECARTNAPLLWDEPSGAEIELFVKRVPAALQPARGQLWMLAGGPGGSVVGLEGIAQFIAGTSPDLDIYLPEHRGVGGSTRLGCPAAEAADSEAGRFISFEELPACLEGLEDTWGEGLDGFSTSSAARDLAHLVDATRAEDEEVIVYGLSYGTMWAHRYLQLFPDQPTAIALDSICAPDCDFSLIDGWLDDVAKKLLDACGEDDVCSSKLGSDPWATLTQALAGLEEGSCPEVAALGFERAVFQQIFAQSLYGFGDRMIIPALAYRLARCDASDVNVFAHLAAVLSTPPPVTPYDEGASDLLGLNIGISELWPDPGPSLDDARTALASKNAALRTTEAYATIDDFWPRYALDGLGEELATSDVPMLMLQGEDDFIPGSWVAPVAARFDGPAQTYVSLPRTTHGAIGNSPAAPVGFPCGLEILRQFVASPGTSLDTACVDFVLPYDFTLAPGPSGSLLGTEDAWEGDPGPQDGALQVHAIGSGAPQTLRERTSLRDRRARLPL